MKRAMAILILVLIIGFASVSAQDATPEATPVPVGIDQLCGADALKLNGDSTLPSDQTAALDDLLKQFVTLQADPTLALSLYAANTPAPGAVVMVVSPQGTYLRAIGAADVQTCAPLMPDMPFAIGSNTKMFTAAIIYQLQEEGKLSTSDPVSKYLPDEISKFPRSADATIDQLLGHTAGLPDYLNAKDPNSIGTLDSIPGSGGLEKGFTPEELVAGAVAQQDSVDQPVFTAGEAGQWAYSNAAYIMLGQIIEKVAGTSYGDALNQRIFQPLGLQHTTMVSDIAPADLGLPSSYLTSPFTYETSGWNYSQAWAAGAIVSTAEDMAVFVKALFTGKLYKQQATLDAMLTRAAPGFSGESDDFYYMHGSYFKAGFDGHGGQTFGFESDAGYNPDKDVAIISWGNASETYAGQGVFFVSHALGLTPSLDEILKRIYQAQLAAQAGEAETNQEAEVETLTVADVVGKTLTLSGIYDAGTKAFSQPPAGTYTIVFDAQGQLTITADCNTVMGSYTAGDENVFTVQLGASTLVACAPDSMSDAMLAMLGKASEIHAISANGAITVSLQAADGSNMVLTASA